MKNALIFVLVTALVAGCAGTPRNPEADETQSRSHGGKVVGAAGGALGGAAMGYSSAGILCTIGGPLCALFVIPVAIVGALVGGVAGSVVDAVKDAKGAPPPEDTSAPQGE